MVSAFARGWTLADVSTSSNGTAVTRKKDALFPSSFSALNLKWIQKDCEKGTTKFG